MANVEIVGKVQIGARTFNLKKNPIFFSEMGELFITATSVQMRILAYGIKDYIVDKILAQRPLYGQRIVRQLPVATKKDKLPEPDEQRVFEQDPLRLQKVIVIPPRDTDPAYIARVPFKVVPLQKKYIQQKEHQGRDGRVFISTGEYLRGIVVRKRTEKDEGTTYVVTLANRVHKLTGLRLHLLALILEYGTRSYTVPFFGDKKHLVKIQLPARPHWRPAFAQLKEAMLRIGQDVEAQVVKEAVRGLS